MPSVERYRDQGRGTWRYRGRYYDAAGGRKSRSFDTKQAALRWASQQEDLVARGGRADPSAAREKWGSWCDRWFAARVTEPSTRRTDLVTLGKHVRPRWGTTALADVSRLEIQAWINTMSSQGNSASVCRRAYYMLSASLKSAVAEGIIAASPCTKITLPTPPHGQERFLSEAESAKILYHLDGPWRVLGELLIGSGLRISEATGLHVSRVDLAAQRIDVIETYDAPEHVMTPYPKSKRRRSVPVSPELAALLQEHLDRHPPAGTCAVRHRGGRCPSGLVFTGERGVAVDGHNFANREWRDACERAGFFTEEKDGKRKLTVRIHDLRHTYASRLAQNGVPIERIQLLLGHSDLKTTQRYAHLLPRDDWDQVRQVLSASSTATRAAADGGPRLRAV